MAPSCAGQRNRRLRIQQRRENWHLADDPPKAELATDADDDAGTDDLTEPLGAVLRTWDEALDALGHVAGHDMRTTIESVRPSQPWVRKFPMS